MDQAQEDFHERRLPGAVAAEEPIDLALLHGDADALQRLDVLVVLDQLGGFYNWHIRFRMIGTINTLLHFPDSV
jgi:hypothetical protein